MEYRSDQEGEGQGQWRTAYYLYDGQGNVRQLVNSRGQVIATYNYLPFGEMMNRGMRGQGIEGNEGIGMNWGRENGLRNTITYQGREYDRDSGLYYYRARYQNPRLGRFLEVDPLLREVPEYTADSTLPTSGNSGCGCSGGSSVNSALYIPYIFTPQQMVPTLPENIAITNLYILENNNPVNVKDPTGFFCITIGWQISPWINVGNSVYLGSYSQLVPSPTICDALNLLGIPCEPGTFGESQNIYYKQKQKNYITYHKMCISKCPPHISFYWTNWSFFSTRNVYQTWQRLLGFLPEAGGKEKTIILINWFLESETAD